MQTLLLMTNVTVYNAQGLQARVLRIGETIKGTRDKFGAWSVNLDGIEFTVFNDEVIAC